VPARGPHHDNHATFEKTERDRSRLAVILPVIRSAKRRPLEYTNGVSEIHFVDPSRQFAFRGIELDFDH
jgi:hypothetical protein